jgi:putative mRNA 3-end processing factor
MTFSVLKRQRALDRGFVLSDHADWQGLNFAVEATGAREIVVTHGYTFSFARWLRERGYDAREADAKAGAHSREVSAVKDDQ